MRVRVTLLTGDAERCPCSPAPVGRGAGRGAGQGAGQARVTRDGSTPSCSSRGAWCYLNYLLLTAHYLLLAAHYLRLAAYVELLEQGCMVQLEDGPLGLRARRLGVEKVLEHDLVVRSE